VTVHRESGEDLALGCRVRLDSATDVEYFEHGGVLPRVLRLKLG
jgi:aconitase A